MEKVKPRKAKSSLGTIPKLKKEVENEKVSCMPWWQKKKPWIKTSDASNIVKLDVYEGGAL